MGSKPTKRKIRKMFLKRFLGKIIPTNVTTKLKVGKQTFSGFLWVKSVVWF